MWLMTHSYVWLMTHSYVWPMTHSYVWPMTHLPICTLYKPSQEMWLRRVCALRCVCAMTHLPFICYDVTHLCLRSCVCAMMTWLICAAYIWYDSDVCVPWLILMCDMTQILLCSRDWLIHDVTWRIRMCAMTHLHVWSDSDAADFGENPLVVHVTWLIHMCAMTHSHVWHDSDNGEIRFFFMHMTWLICVCDMTHLCVCHDSFMCVRWLRSCWC